LTAYGMALVLFPAPGTLGLVLLGLVVILPVMLPVTLPVELPVVMLLAPAVELPVSEALPLAVLLGLAVLAE